METLKIREDAYLKLMAYVNNTEGEISGYAKTEIDAEKNCTIVDAVIFKQTCSGASTELDDDAQAKFLYELEKKNESPEHWNVWWHSHAEMNLFWSSTDSKNIQEKMGNMNFLISLVLNKKGENKCRLDTFPKDLSPFDIPIVFTKDDIPVEIEYEIEKHNQLAELEQKINVLEMEIQFIKDGGEPAKEIEKAAKVEIKEKVTDFSWSSKGRKKRISEIGFNPDELIEQDYDFIDKVRTMQFGNSALLDNCPGNNEINFDGAYGDYVLNGDEMTYEERIQSRRQGYVILDSAGDPFVEDYDELDWEDNYNNLTKQRSI